MFCMTFLNVIWEMEVIPDELKKGLLIKIPKKGNLSHCGNWRGISLLSVSSKIVIRIILERLKTALDVKLSNEQAGFRSARSCVEDNCGAFHRMAKHIVS